MVRFSRGALAVCPMSHPLIRWPLAPMRHREGNVLKDQTSCQKFRALPLNRVECGAVNCGGGGDDVMIVKDNQPQLKADIELVFTRAPAGDRQAHGRTVDIGHGRIETRNLRRVRRWWATVRGQGWHRCSK